MFVINGLSFASFLMAKSVYVLYIRDRMVEIKTNTTDF